MASRFQRLSDLTYPNLRGGSLLDLELLDDDVASTSDGVSVHRVAVAPGHFAVCFRRRGCLDVMCVLDRVEVEAPQLAPRVERWLRRYIFSADGTVPPLELGEGEEPPPILVARFSRELASLFYSSSKDGELRLFAVQSDGEVRVWQWDCDGARWTFLCELFVLAAVAGSEGGGVDSRVNLVSAVFDAPSGLFLWCDHHSGDGSWEIRSRQIGFVNSDVGGDVGHGRVDLDLHVTVGCPATLWKCPAEGGPLEMRLGQCGLWVTSRDELRLWPLREGGMSPGKWDACGSGLFCIHDVSDDLIFVDSSGRVFVCGVAEGPSSVAADRRVHTGAIKIHMRPLCQLQGGLMPVTSNEGTAPTTMSGRHQTQNTNLVVAHRDLLLLFRGGKCCMYDLCTGARLAERAIPCASVGAAGLFGVWSRHNGAFCPMGVFGARGLWRLVSVPVPERIEQVVEQTDMLRRARFASRAISLSQLYGPSLAAPRAALALNTVAQMSTTRVDGEGAGALPAALPSDLDEAIRSLRPMLQSAAIPIALFSGSRRKDEAVRSELSGQSRGKSPHNHPLDEFTPLNRTLAPSFAKIFAMVEARGHHTGHSGQTRIDAPRRIPSQSLDSALHSADIETKVHVTNCSADTSSTLRWQQGVPGVEREVAEWLGAITSTQLVTWGSDPVSRNSANGEHEVPTQAVLQGMLAALGTFVGSANDDGEWDVKDEALFRSEPTVSQDREYPGDRGISVRLPLFETVCRAFFIHDPARLVAFVSCVHSRCPSHLKGQTAAAGPGFFLRAYQCLGPLITRRGGERRAATGASGAAARLLARAGRPSQALHLCRRLGDWRCAVAIFRTFCERRASRVNLRTSIGTAEKKQRSVIGRTSGESAVDAGQQPSTSAGLHRRMFFDLLLWLSSPEWEAGSDTARTTSSGPCADEGDEGESSIRHHIDALWSLGPADLTAKELIEALQAGYTTRPNSNSSLQSNEPMFAPPTRRTQALPLGVLVGKLLELNIGPT